MNTTQIGDIQEQKFVLYCLENEIPISRPIGNNLPYDFIIEYNGNLYKIQVKTAYVDKNNSDIWTFNTRSTSKNYSEIVNKNYKGKIDYFAAIRPDNGIICFIPVDKAASSSMRLYYGENPKPSQNYYKNYLLNNIL